MKDLLLSHLPLHHPGKVGDVYVVDEDYLLLLRSDRVSGFNVKLLSTMPYKGCVLNQLSAWWMNGVLQNIIPNHLTNIQLASVISDEVDLKLAMGRASVVKKLKPVMVEAVVRRHLTGSGYKSYLETGQICGITLPAGLRDGNRLDEIIFTPTEKSDTDPAITFDQMEVMIGATLAEQIRDVSLQIFQIAEAYLMERGIILADTKIEFGLDHTGALVLMDEVLTPDSSRLWLKDAYENGKIVSLDKQKIRDWMKANNVTVPTVLPDDLIQEVSQDYVRIFELITGQAPVLS